MAEAGEQIDRYWEDVMILTERLTAVAGRLFRGRGCSNVEAVLPGTGKCAVDLVEETIADLIERGYWIPGSEGEDPFPVAHRALKRDFLDLIKSAGYRTTQIAESIEAEYADKILTSNSFDQADAALLVNSLRPHLRNDKPAIDLLEVLVVKGIEDEADIAREMSTSERDVRNIKRRLRSKIRLWVRLGLTDRQ